MGHMSEEVEKDAALDNRVQRKTLRAQDNGILNVPILKTRTRERDYLYHH